MSQARERISALLPVRLRGRASAVNGDNAQRRELERRRERLAAQVAELQLDLGGLAYEMAIRDHFRLDVLVRQAADLQRLDGELGALDRLLALEDAGSAGSCPQCAALHAYGATFCWQCGTRLLEESTSSAPAVRA